MDKNSTIFVAGHTGLVGSALVRLLKSLGYQRLVLRTRQECDLRCRESVQRLFEREQPHFVFLAAATVGGIAANARYPVEFLADNLAIQTNVLQMCHQYGALKVLQFGSSCMYPREAPQPIAESSLMSGPLEPTSEPYAVAKIAGLRLAQAYAAEYDRQIITVVPATLYGPHDNFDLERSHVLPGLLHRFHLAARQRSNEVTIWGSGTPVREFLHVDDLARACLFLMEHYHSPELLNVGSSREVSIADLAGLIRVTTGFTGRIAFDRTRPDGALRKVLDSSRIRRLGWKPEVSLEQGLESAYRWFIKVEGDSGTAS